MKFASIFFVLIHCLQAATISSPDFSQVIEQVWGFDPTDLLGKGILFIISDVTDKLTQV